MFHQQAFQNFSVWPKSIMYVMFVHLKTFYSGAGIICNSLCELNTIFNRNDLTFQEEEEAKSDVCFDECISDGDGSHCENCTMARKAKNLVESTIRPFRDVLYLYICVFVLVYLYWCICISVFVSASLCICTMASWLISQQRNLVETTMRPLREATKESASPQPTICTHYCSYSTHLISNGQEEICGGKEISLTCRCPPCNRRFYELHYY